MLPATGWLALLGEAFFPRVGNAPRTVALADLRLLVGARRARPTALGEQRDDDCVALRAIGCTKTGAATAAVVGDDTDAPLAQTSASNSTQERERERESGLET